MTTSWSGAVRRLRAVFVIGAVSAVIWAVVGVVVTGVFLLALGIGLNIHLFLVPVAAFAVVGFVGGAIWSVGVATVRHPDTGPLLSARRAAVTGLVGGLLVAAAFVWALHDGSTSVAHYLPWPILTFALGGAGTGLLIQRTASRVQLPPARDDSSNRLEP